MFQECFQLFFQLSQKMESQNEIYMFYMLMDSQHFETGNR